MGEKSGADALQRQQIATSCLGAAMGMLNAIEIVQREWSAAIERGASQPEILAIHSIRTALATAYRPFFEEAMAASDPTNAYYPPRKDAENERE